MMVSSVLEKFASTLVVFLLVNGHGGLMAFLLGALFFTGSTNYLLCRAQPSAEGSVRQILCRLQRGEDVQDGEERHLGKATVGTQRRAYQICPLRAGSRLRRILGYCQILVQMICLVM